MQKTTVTTLETEIADIEKQAAADKATLQSKLDELNGKRAEFHQLCVIATEAEQRLQNAREQLEITNAIRADAEGKLGTIVGGVTCAYEWFKTVSTSPTAIESWVHSGSNNRHPMIVHGEVIAACNASAGVINRLLPEIEAAATSARRAADSFAKSNGITD